MVNFSWPKANRPLLPGTWPPGESVQFFDQLGAFLGSQELALRLLRSEVDIGISVRRSNRNRLCIRLLRGGGSSRRIRLAGSDWRCRRRRTGLWKRCGANYWFGRDCSRSGDSGIRRPAVAGLCCRMTLRIPHAVQDQGIRGCDSARSLIWLSHLRSGSRGLYTTGNDDRKHRRADQPPLGPTVPFTLCRHYYRPLSLAASHNIQYSTCEAPAESLY